MVGVGLPLRGRWLRYFLAGMCSLFLWSAGRDGSLQTLLTLLSTDPKGVRIAAAQPWGWGQQPSRYGFSWPENPSDFRIGPISLWWIARPWHQSWLEALVRGVIPLAPVFPLLALWRRGHLRSAKSSSEGPEFETHTDRDAES